MFVKLYGRKTLKMSNVVRVMRVCSNETNRVSTSAVDNDMHAMLVFVRSFTG